MRHLQAVVLVLSVGLAGCCWTANPFRRSSSPTSPPSGTGETAQRPTDTSPGTEVVFLDVALVRRPRGDRFIDQDLWEQVDEQGLGEEVKPTLLANGLRICQVGGLLPEGLLSLLGSPRSAPDPRRLRANLGQPTDVQVGPTRPRLTCRVTLPDGARSLDVELARCTFSVVATLEEEKRIRLRFMPTVRHGRVRMKPQVARDADGSLRWEVEPSEPIEEFGQLSWELTIGSGEYIVLGTRSDRPGTLGHAYFMPEGERAIQYLLVLRASRMAGGSTPPETTGLAPPLAAQAGGRTARGKMSGGR